MVAGVGLWLCALLCYTWGEDGATDGHITRETPRENGELIVQGERWEESSTCIRARSDSIDDDKERSAAGASTGRRRWKEDFEWT